MFLREMKMMRQTLQWFPFLAVYFAACILMLPQPRACAANAPQVGCYYFDGWADTTSHNFHVGDMPQKWQEREPLSGWYDNTAKLVHQQVAWARQADISFFIFDWYDARRDGNPSDQTLNTAVDFFRKDPHKIGMKYALLYVNNGSFSIPQSEWTAACDNWIKRDFKNPAYYKIDGKPLLVVFSVGDMERTWGGADGVKGAWDQLRKLARKAGLPGVFVVACATPGPKNGWTNLNTLVNEGYDAYSAYNYAGFGGTVKGANPYSIIVKGSEGIWNDFAADGRKPYIPIVTDGWDSRPWNETPWWYERTPNQFRNFVSDALRWWHANPAMRVMKNTPLIFVEAWNELGEGSYIVPTKGTGFTYLNALKRGLEMGMAAINTKVKIDGPWSIEVEPGEIHLPGKTVRVAKRAVLKIKPPETVRIVNEQHANLPVFNDNTGGWMKGAKLDKLDTEECTATGLLEPESVVVKSSPDSTSPYVAGKDYQFDPFWATIGRLPGGAIGPNDPVYIDYSYTPERLDCVVVSKTGKVFVVEGKPGVGAMDPPVPPAGDTDIANIWLPGKVESLTDANLYPIEPPLPPEKPKESVAERLLPRTLAKLRDGGHVTIVAWGDSVTAGGGVGGDPAEWYQNRFVTLLRKRFPKADITLKTAAWPGGNSRGYLDSPAGSQYDFQRDVLDPKPDLVTVEFVNDAYMNEQQVFSEYTEILNKLHSVGAEVILIAPHLVRPDWMGVTGLKFDQDPRPYVTALRKFARDNHVALADVSAAWCHLWREGIPYVTLLANSINHPDARGHEIFAQTLLNLFPKR